MNHERSAHSEITRATGTVATDTIATGGTALIVEGGGMRGIFSAGVLDVFHEAGLAPFDLAMGCSAGACNVASYLAGQHGRNLRCYTTQMVRTEFLSARRFLLGGHMLDIDYLWDAFAREDPLDVDGVMRATTMYLIPATSVASGTAKFLTPTHDNMHVALHASCALPILYRKFVELDGESYTDGGVTAAVPVEEAYRRGARRILVVRSRTASYVKNPRIEPFIGSWWTRRTPELARAIREAPAAYRRTVAFIGSPPADCYIQQVAPDAPLRTGRTTRDVDALKADYELGRRAGHEAVEQWRRSEVAAA